MTEVKAVQAQLVGKLGHVTQELDKITAKSNSLEQQNRKGGPITTTENQLLWRIPAREVAGLPCGRDDHGPSLSGWRRGPPGR